MSKNCVVCVENERTGNDLLCDECRIFADLSRRMDVRFPESEGFRECLNSYIDSRIKRALNDRRKIGLRNVLELDE
jgi:hypothetical protein